MCHHLGHHHLTITIVDLESKHIKLSPELRKASFCVVGNRTRYENIVRYLHRICCNSVVIQNLSIGQLLNGYLIALSPFRYFTGLVSTTNANM